MESANSLPDGWSQVKLGDVVEFKYGKALPAKKRDNNGYPVYGSNGIVGYHSEPLIQNQSIIIGRKGSIGEVHHTDSPCSPIDTTYYIDDLHGQPVKFWKNYLGHLPLKKMNRAVALPGLNRNEAYELDVCLPPLAEQKRISAKIDLLQSKSRKAKYHLEAAKPLLEKLRQSILASAFRGDLTAEWRKNNPDVEPASVLLERIRRGRREKWEEAELEKMRAKGKEPKNDKWKEKYKEPEPLETGGLPELPEGWCWARWDQVGFCQNGRAFPSKHYSKSGVKLLRPGNLYKNGTVGWNEKNTRYLPESWEKEYPSYIIGPNELVINLTAQSLKDEFLGRVCITGEEEHCLLNQRIARLTSIQIEQSYLLWLFKSPVFRKYVESLNTGTLIQHMFTSQVYEFAFPFPPNDEQVEIEKRINIAIQALKKMDEKLSSSESSLENIDQSILAKAFRGELVPQDPNDEPASILLERIKAEREAGHSKKRNRKNIKEEAREGDQN